MSNAEVEILESLSTLERWADQHPTMTLAEMVARLKAEPFKYTEDDARATANFIFQLRDGGTPSRAAALWFFQSGKVQ